MFKSSSYFYKNDTYMCHLLLCTVLWVFTWNKCKQIFSVGTQYSRLIVIVSVTKFAKEVVAPLVKEMDETSHMPSSLIKDLFEHGVSTGTIASIVSMLGQCFPCCVTSEVGQCHLTVFLSQGTAVCWNCHLIVMSCYKCQRGRLKHPSDCTI